MKPSAPISSVIQAFGYPATTVQAVQRGYRNHSYAFTDNQGANFNLVQYKREPDIPSRIRRLHWLGTALTNAGLPVRAPADPRILQTAGQHLTYFGLYTYLPGHTIPWGAYTQRHLKLTGLALARFHANAARLSAPANFRAYTAASELSSLLAHMQAYFANSAVTTALAHKLRLHINPAWFTGQSALIAQLAQLPGQRPLHLDFVRGNLLFAPATPTDPLQLDGLALTGILDLEKAAWGAPVIDLARTLAFLLVDCKYKTPRQIRKYFLYSGYTKRGRGAASHPLLEPLVTFFLFYDFYKFLRHNPYESLHANQHFRRTVGALLTRNVLSARQTNFLDDTISKSGDGV